MHRHRHHRHADPDIIPCSNIHTNNPLPSEMRLRSRCVSSASNSRACTTHLNTTNTLVRLTEHDLTFNVCVCIFFPFVFTGIGVACCCCLLRSPAHCSSGLPAQYILSVVPPSLPSPFASASAVVRSSHLRTFAPNRFFRQNPAGVRETFVLSHSFCHNSQSLAKQSYAILVLTIFTRFSGISPVQFTLLLVSKNRVQMGANTKIIRVKTQIKNHLPNAEKRGRRSEPSTS